MPTDLDQLDPPADREALLTAYALGELDEPARGQVESQLQGDDAGRLLVQQIRSAADLVTDELAREPVPQPLAELRRVVDDRIEQRLRLHRRAIARKPLIWSPLVLLLTALVIIGAAAVGMFIVFMLSQNGG